MKWHYVFGDNNAMNDIDIMFNTLFIDKFIEGGVGEGES